MKENVPAVDLMLACSTQWRSGGFGLIGLDYVAVRYMAEIMEISMDAAIMRKIGLMERLTLKRLTEEAGRDRPGAKQPPQGRSDARGSHGRFN